MRYPIWLLNSILLLFFFFIFITLLLLKPHSPSLKPFLPLEEMKSFHKPITKIDLKKIYMDDLFETSKGFAAPVMRPVEQDERKMPLPPAMIPTTRIPTQAPKFLEPLKIELRGIIVGSDESRNIAIIEDTKNKHAHNLHIGDIIEDAQLSRILQNKIIFIRSNGQQETLYVNQYDAELELLLSPANWSKVIKKTADNAFIIDPDRLTEKIHSLAQFIDQLNITTVYHHGKSIGCRIGKIDAHSIGFGLGFIPGDIILEVNQISTATTQSRLQIYESTKKLPLGSTIQVKISRKGRLITLEYTLKTIPIARTSSVSITATPPKTTREIEEEKKEILKEKEALAETAESFRKKEKENIVKLIEKQQSKSRNILEKINSP